MSYRNLKSKLFRTIGSLSVAGMVFAGAVVAFSASSPQAAQGGDITPPPLPAGLFPVPAGNKLFLGTHAVGTQNYVCRPSGAGVAYVLFTPEATLFGEDGGQVITHDFTPNPFEPNTDPKVVAPGGTIRATWQYRDTSSVWAKVHQPPVMERSPSTDGDCLAHARCGWSPERTDRWRHAVQDHLRPAAEHHWRARTVDGLHR